MRGAAGRALLAGLALLSGAAAATAQTNDHLFRAYARTEDQSAPRAAGLAGAFVGLADDSSATFLNPAGIAMLPKTELAASVKSRASGTTPLGDRLESRVGVGFLGGAGRLGEHWAVGGYLIEPFDSRASLTGLPELGGTGVTEITVIDGGGAVAWRPNDRVALGLRINDTYLRIESLFTRAARNGAQDLRVGIGGGEHKITGDFGVLLLPSDELRIGASYRQGVSWNVDRTADSPATGAVLDAGSIKLVRSPSVASGGLSYELSPKVLFSAQLDYVLYSQILGDLGLREAPFTASDYELDDAVEPRAGLELSWPIGNTSVQFRGGVASVASGSMRYAGADVVEATVFAGRDRLLLGSAGASWVSRSGARLDVAATFGGDRTVIVAGGAYRF